MSDTNDYKPNQQGLTYTPKLGYAYQYDKEYIGYYVIAEFNINGQIGYAIFNKRRTEELIAHTAWYDKPSEAFDEAKKKIKAWQIVGEPVESPF